MLSLTNRQTDGLAVLCRGEEQPAVWDSRAIAVTEAGGQQEAGWMPDPSEEGEGNYDWKRAAALLS
jgi:hypothetical protein